ncbi:hypothetical protein BDV38DRAFT_281972 [Aspergillus pseudotamarii]|uniref:C2H2-type domain-containing protein n=1 Tax=Aspergillus pseudotamarii TaxID=132259 RepID=A0A5N6SVJ6_ASPPS|nr:uncharacterized protein BDV38DRAFT_281972 [Aspergillus pseudotamarii]KAE8138675.1 hypothetical protein BDV38DRAFT_281972 [Aspergillus pseudotamarii]
MAISKATASCLQSFTECLAVEALMTDEWTENRLADFNLWISGVGASARGRASLDSRLIARPEARKVIENLLKLLAGVVNDLKRQAVSGPDHSMPEFRNSQSAPAPQEPPPRPFSPWSTDSDSDSREDNESRLGSTRNPLHEGMQNVEMMLDQLARIGVSIRQSGRRSRLQKADQRFRPEGHKELEQHLSTILLARPEFSKDGIELSKLTEVQQRLIHCNLKRRNRFLYAQQHSKGLDSLSPMDQFTTPVTDMKPTDPQPGLKDQRPGAANAKMSSGQGDGKTGTSASAVSESYLLDGIPVPAPATSTIMSSTVIDLEYPRPPIVSKEAQLFRCPCCCVALPMFFLETNRWMKHVADDVSPYSCILSGCSNPYVLYSTKESWRKHLLTEHSSFEYYICFACTDKKQLYSENEFTMHIRIQHASTIPPDRIPLLTPLCKRSAPVKITSCPLCTWPEGEDGEVDKDVLLDHIAKEIHAFSLRALPWADDNGQETDERIEYSTNKVRDWLVENNLSVNPSEERPVRERRSYLSEYFEQNAYFGGSSAASNSSDVDTVLSWEVELDNLKEVDGPLSFGSGEYDVSSKEDTDNGKAYSELDSGRPESLGVDIPYRKDSDDDEPGSDVDSLGPISWGSDIPNVKSSHDDEPNSNIDSGQPGGWGGDILYIKGFYDDEPKSDVASVGPVGWGSDISHIKRSQNDGIQSEFELEKPGSEALSDKRSGTPNKGPNQQHPASSSPAAQSLSGALLTSADNVEDVAAGFRMLREPLPEHATEITILISDLYSISSSLRGYSTILGNGIHQQNIASAESDIELVRTSLKKTLDDIFDFFGDIDLRQGSDRDKYQRTWTVMCKYFYDKSQGSLANRLAIYKAFLGELANISNEGFSDGKLMANLRRHIESLQDSQTSRSTLKVGPASPTASNPHGPDSVDDDSSRDQPGSVSNHWVKTVFETNTSSTPIPETGESSECFGEPQVDVKTWLHYEGFRQALQLPFPDQRDTLVSFYVRDFDHCVRILCERVSVNEPHDYYCLPLDMLEIVRVGSCLQLCRRRRQGQELVLWLNLKFTTIESMVCFFSTFLALRSQDRGRPVERIRDYELDMENELYGGLIFAGKDLHALRIYQDGSSRAVRLQASMYRGEMKYVPVWTAFITQHMKSEGWIRLMPPTLVLLRELHKIVFNFSDNSPQRTRDGEYVIQFTTDAVRANAKLSAAAVFVNIATDSSWSSTAVVFFLKVMPGPVAFGTCDAATHMAEERKLPTCDVPRVMIGSALLHYLAAIPTMIIYLFCIVNPQTMLSPVGSQLLIQLLSDGHASKALTVIAGALILVSFTIGWWAALGVTFNAPILSTVLGIAIGAIQLGSTTALNAGLAGASLCCGFSWIVVFTFREWRGNDLIYSVGLIWGSGVVRCL